MPVSHWKKLRDSLGQLAALAALVGGCLVVSGELWPRLDRWHQVRLADELSERVAATPDDEVKVPLRQLASLGTPALGRLVEAAASPRGAVASIAQREIDIALSAALIQLREDASAPPVETLLALSVGLVEHVSHFGPSGRQWVEGLVLRMIEASDRLPPESAADLLAATSRVLDGIPPRAPRAGKIAAILADPLAGAERVTVDVATLAGPSERAVSMPSIDESRAQPLTEALAEPPIEDETVTPPEEAWTPQWIGIRTIPAPAPLPPLAGDATLSVNVRDSVPSVPIDVPTPLDFKRRVSDLRRLSNQELLAQLGTAGKFAAGAIRTVLTERGVDAVEAETAARIKAADEAQRLQIVDEVSKLPAAAARRLLRLLLSDSSGEVRLQALTTLATTNDPELERLARTIAVEDQDPRVAELATKLLEK